MYLTVSIKMMFLLDNTVMANLHSVVDPALTCTGKVLFFQESLDITDCIFVIESIVISCAFI